MSVQAMSWVFEFSESRGTDRLVLLAIAHRVSNDNGEAFPSVKRLAHEANLSERAVHYSIRSLVDSGEMAVKLSASAYGTNIYWLPKFNAWVQSLHPPVQTVHPPRCKVRQGGGANLAPESSEENRNKEQEKTFGAGARPKKRTPLPDPFEIDPDGQSFAVQAGVADPAHEFEVFKDYHRAKGSTFKDWAAAWRTWCNNYRRFARGINHGQTKSNIEITLEGYRQLQAMRTH